MKVSELYVKKNKKSYWLFVNNNRNYSIHSYYYRPCSKRNTTQLYKSLTTNVIMYIFFICWIMAIKGR